MSGSPDPLDLFHPAVREWFRASFAAPSPAQAAGWPLIASGESTLLLAPTGSGKTLAAFLFALDRLMFGEEPGQGCRVLYVSPLKALAVDIERNLRAPLVGISHAARRLGGNVREVEVALRTGDTPAAERRRFARRPADILVTTPESLFLLLTSSAREALRGVRWVIVDEIHTMVGGKRGVHLALSLERLQRLAPHPFQRIGLTATVRPVQEAALWLGGWDAVQEAPRPVRIADAGTIRTLDLTVETAVEDMARVGEIVEIPSGPAARGTVRSSIWPSVHPLLLDLIRAHRTTLIFVNSRRLAERLAAALNELAGEPLVRAHHGSIAREQRLQIEDDLKAGRLPALVATSSLELGIDMGAIELVVQVEAPPSVTSGLQRIGRSGRRLDVPSRGLILPKFRGDLLACAATVPCLLRGEVEDTRIPTNPLDVLAQQLVAMTVMDDWTVDELAALVAGAAPYRELSRGQLEGVLDMLTGRLHSDELLELRPRITWDRLTGAVTARAGSRRVVLSNSGTIPDRGLFGVFLASDEGGQSRTSRRVGELDEEMVFESRAGDTFILGASTWRIEQITHDRVVVSPAPGETGRMPFWKAEGPGRSLQLGRAVGRLTRELADQVGRPGGAARAAVLLEREHRLTAGAAQNLTRYVQDQLQATEVCPDDRTVLIESSMDELGDWRVCVLSPFGRRVHGPWAMAIEALWRRETDREIDLYWTDDGIVLRFPESDVPPETALLLPDPDETPELIQLQLGRSMLFAARFREAAARALLLPRRSPGRRTPLWQQRRRSSDLMQAAAGSGSFPIVLEAYRECLAQDFDVPGLVGILEGIRRRSLRAVPVVTQRPSPFASNVLFQYVGNFMYEGDVPLSERRARALTVDQSQLRELLGEVELRELLDPEAIDGLEAELQCLAEERQARGPDGLHDLLLRLGDLSREEVLLRCREGRGEEWLDGLAETRRAVAIPLAGERRWIAVEDVARYRDAAGVPAPLGLPAALLEPVRDPFRDLVFRFARTHGPFRTEEAARRLGTGEGPTLTCLEALESEGRVVRGGFRPGRAGQEWCESGVLRALRARSLARLRREVAPCEAARLAAFALSWHGVDRARRGPSALEEAIEQLQGLPLPASELEGRILPQRVSGYDPRMLDEMTASGLVTWVGVEALGDADGRVILCLTESTPLLLPPPRPVPQGCLAWSLLEYLGERGASFFSQLTRDFSRASPMELLEALWELVWSGNVTNDTLQPLRSYLRGRPRAEAARPGRPRAGRFWLPPQGAGRWALSPTGEVEPAARRLMARARQLLERHGVLTREAVRFESDLRGAGEGGFSPLYPVLKGMEETGSIRRGYFVAGLGATQFALPPALERLRERPPSGSERADRAVILAATDPANVYGAAVPWPSPPEGDGAPVRPARQAGASVILLDGVLIAWVGSSPRGSLLLYDRSVELGAGLAEEAVARCLSREVDAGRRRAVILARVNGRSVGESSLAPALRSAGFVYGPQGFMKRR